LSRGEAQVRGPLTISQGSIIVALKPHLPGLQELDFGMVRVGPRQFLQKQTTLLGSHGFSSLLKITGKSLAAPKYRKADADG